MFIERLTVSLTVTTSGQAHTVRAGFLKDLDLALTPWGFTAAAEWWSRSLETQGEDQLFSDFVLQDPILVELTLARAFSEISPSAETPGDTLSLKGVVTERTVVERAFPGVQGAPVLHRRYRIRFADRASVLWRQHRPCALYVNKTKRDLLDDNLPKGVTLDHAWAAASLQHPVLSLGLGAPTNEASFYDFVFWLADRENVGLYYDLAQDRYALRDAKPSGSPPIPLREKCVASLETVFTEVRRDAVTVLNAFTDAAPQKNDIPNAKSITGVRRDYLIRSPIAAHLGDRTRLETARARPAEPELHVELAEFPAKILSPSAAVTLDSSFSSKVYPFGTTFRVLTTTLRAKATNQGATENANDVSARFELDYALHLERATDPCMRYPVYANPVWPFYVEGKVLSEVGSPSELTFESYVDPQTSLDHYKIKVPLWGDIKVIVRYEPLSYSGHVFFPLYKDERVLLALGFNEAKIHSFLDWRPGVRLPQDTQGDHILLGKEDRNQTSIRHVYEDAKPTLTIERTMGADHQVIKISEGGISMSTRDH